MTNMNLKQIRLLIILTTVTMQQLVLARSFPPANVNVVAAEIKSLSPISWVSGTVISRNNSQLSAEVSGRLINIASIGTKVSRGEVLAQIDDKPLLLSRDENRASVVSEKSRFKYLESEVKRINSLSLRKLSSQKDVDEAVSKRDVATGDLAAAKARLAQSIQDLAYSKVTAPFDGIVTQRLSNLGEYVVKGKAIILFVETANLEAAIFAPLTAYRFLNKSSKLAVESPLGIGTAEIVSLVPVADTRSHLMQVRLDMSDFDWPVGLNMKAAVANGNTEEVLAVPRDSLVLRRDNISIFRINKDNIAEQILVTLGMGAGEFVEVKGDVKEGDLIVIRGAERLQNGQKVQIKQNNESLISGKKTNG
ncbi:MAG: RND family efflux transporter MFP subunit [Enterobacterales bacterium]|jgi:RND family efflux transporter MFP subunit